MLFKLSNPHTYFKEFTETNKTLNNIMQDKKQVTVIKDNFILRLVLIKSHDYSYRGTF